jgi:DNA invertase Pin-like site-specific DNA recombinase
MDAESKKPIAYSYVRFSSAQQALGDSLRRQVALAEEYCREHGLELHPVSFKDLGVSAFKRKNIETGALSAFIQAVREKKIAKGSYLIIEQFDRLSRADVRTALTLFLSLTAAGIKIVTLSDKKVWDDSPEGGDMLPLMTALVYMARAHDESKSKSRRLAEVWGQKKKNAAQRILTSECPRWLRLNSDRTGFVVQEKIVESIRQVFDMRINGHGAVAIVARANRENWPVPGKPPTRRAGEMVKEFEERKARSPESSWHLSLIGRLLKNRALLGEYQPRSVDPDGSSRRIAVGEPVRDYYPAVLDETTFLRAQAVAARRGRFPGRRDAAMKNWLYGIVRCQCGQSLVRKNKQSSKQPGYSRFYCTARVRGVTRCPSVNTSELEMVVLYFASTHLPRSIGAAPVEELKAKVDALETKIAGGRRAIESLSDAIADMPEPTARRGLMSRMEKEGAALSAHERELSDARAALADWSGLSVEEADVEMKRLNERLTRMASGIDGPESTMMLREELARWLDKIVVHQAADCVELFIKGRDTPISVPFDFVRGEDWEPTAEQLEAAERDIDALRQAMGD